MTLLIRKTPSAILSLLIGCFLLSGTFSLGKDVDTNTSQQTDYNKRVLSIDNFIRNQINHSTIDSIAKVTHRMLDSIRGEIIKQKDKDSIRLLTSTLNNGINDSLLLIRISDVLNSATGNKTGALSLYCIDFTNQNPLGLVKISVYSHDSLLRNYYSANDGFCKIADLKPGEYSLTFSKKKYTSFTDKWLKVTAGNVTCIEIPLSISTVFCFSPFIWIIISVAVILVFVLIYSIIKKIVKIAQ